MELAADLDTPNFDMDPTEQREKCLEFAGLMTVANDYYTSIKGIEAYSKMCVMATNLSKECPRSCNTLLKRVSTPPTAETCKTLPKELLKECSARANGTLVWQGALDLAVGTAALLTVSIALF